MSELIPPPAVTLSLYPATDPDPIRSLILDALAGNDDLGRLILAYLTAPAASNQGAEAIK